MTIIDAYPRPEVDVPRPVSEKRERQFSRRTFAKMLALVVAPPSTFLAQDRIKSEIYWAGTYPDVHEVYASKERIGEYKRGGFFLPGFNVANIGHGAEAQLPALKTTCEYLAHVTYGNNGFDMRDIYRSVKKTVKEQNLERVMFMGQSMGGPIAIDLAAKLNDDGIITDRIFMYSSPLNINHIQADSQKVVTGLAQIDHPLLRLGPDTRFGIEIGRQLYAGESIGSAVSSAQHMMTPEGCSNTLLETISSFMNDFELVDYVDRMPLETQYVYMCTSLPKNDDYVDVTKPPIALQSTLLGNKIILTSPHVGHADITVSAEPFRAMARDGIAQCDYHDYIHALEYPDNAGGI